MFLSVIIPTYNRRDALRECLDALALQDYPRDTFEVIVVDDGGSQTLAGIEEEIRREIDCRFFRQSRSGPAAARNLGALKAKGDYLVFTDDDCQPSSDWLTRIQQSAALNPNALIGGRVVNALTRNPYSAASHRLIDFLYESYTKNGKPRFFTSNNIALSKAAFESLGGFDESFPRAAAEDRDFCARWAEAGRHMLYTPSAVVQHAHSLTLSGFVRQHFHYGQGAYLFRQRAVSGNRNRPKLEPLSFYFHLLFYPLKSSHSVRNLGTSLLFLVSQIANAAGYFANALRTAPPRNCNQQSASVK